MKLRKNGAHPAVKSDMRFWILCVCFLLGMAAAYPARRSISADALAQLGAYVQSYAQLADGRSQQPVSVLSAAAAYLRYPLLAFLFGLSAAGVALIPLLCAAQGFFLSFSVCCFTAAFGVDGVLLALAVFGLRCMVTLPCYFLLAAASWGTSAGLAAVSFGRGRRTAPVVYGRACWVRFGACCLALLAGVCAELFLSPVLLRLMLERILG